MMVGAFSLNATTNEGSGSIANLGNYSITYSSNITDHFELGLGYSLFMTGVVGGDLGYGIDASVNYFPLTYSSRYSENSINSNVSISSLWRPFVGASFHQRQFQSVNSSYAGFGVSAGTEVALDMSFDFKAYMRYIALSGPNDASATQMDFLLGITFPFNIK